MPKNDNYSDMSIVTEIGAFGSLNIDDPTVKKVKKNNGEDVTGEEVSELIKEAIESNSNICIEN